MSRHTETTTSTTVRHVAEPLASKGRENGPHLGDLRKFVEDCHGLPDSIVVRITKGALNASGRGDVTLETTWSRPTTDTANRAKETE